MSTGLGRSERLLGRLLRTVDRSTIVVSSKVGYFAGTACHPYQPAQMRHRFATTLDNLGTDYLDIYHLHSSDFGPDDQYRHRSARRGADSPMATSVPHHPARRPDRPIQPAQPALPHWRHRRLTLTSFAGRVRTTWSSSARVRAVAVLLGVDGDYGILQLSMGAELEFLLWLWRRVERRICAFLVQCLGQYVRCGVGRPGG
jgi:hypothetical protein